MGPSCFLELQRIVQTLRDSRGIYFSSWCDGMFFSPQAHHLLPSTWFQMSMRHQWTWNGVVLRAQVAVRTFLTMWSARSVELETPASADPVEVGSTIPHSRMAWKQPKSPSLTSWHTPTILLKSGPWMECPSITQVQTNQCLSLWQPTKQVGIQSFVFHDLILYREKGLWWSPVVLKFCRWSGTNYKHGNCFVI